MHIFQGSYWSGTFGPYMDSFIESAIHRKINVASSNSTLEWIKTKIILLVDRILSALSSAYQKRYNEINNKIQKNLSNESPSTPQVAQVKKVENAANMAAIINSATVEEPIEISTEEKPKEIPKLLEKAVLIEQPPENHPQVSENVVSTSNDSVENSSKKNQILEETVLIDDHNVEELSPSPPLKNSITEAPKPIYHQSKNSSLADFPTLNNEAAFANELMYLGMTSSSPDPHEANEKAVDEITKWIDVRMADEDIMAVMEEQISRSECLELITKIRTSKASVENLFSHEQAGFLEGVQ